MSGNGGSNNRVLLYIGKIYGFFAAYIQRIGGCYGDKIINTYNYVGSGGWIGNALGFANAVEYLRGGYSGTVLAFNV